MKDKIEIAEELKLPIDAITQTFAQIGRKGSGKTYLASMIAEQMLDVQAQVIVIDPIGNWWGLRVNADGKGKGKDIFIIGGTHGDVPLASEGGKEIAKLLVEKNISVVLDISEFRKNERKKFVTDFAEEFYQLKKTNPSAVHIFLEESQKFVPQRVQKDEARMVGAWEDIVRLGRNYGIGCSLISQRPQSINKEVLSQVECLCVLQITGLHERKALEEWIQEAGEDRKLVGHLPSLHQGEGYVWSPSWLRIFKKVTFNKKTTFDTSATPELGKATKSAKISEMDIEKLREQMTQVVQKINKEKLDRKGLIEENNRLNSELRKRPKEQITKEIKVVDEKLINNARQQGFKEAEIKFSNQFKELEKSYRICQKKLIDIGKIIGAFVPQEKFEVPKLNQSVPTYLTKPVKTDFKPKLSEKPPIIYDSDVKLKSGAIRILNFVAMFQRLTKEKAKTLCGISSKGTFGNYVADLSRAGFIESNENILKITNEGKDFIGEVVPMPTNTESLINLWSKHLKSGAIRMLRICVEKYPELIDKEDLREKVGISSIGTFGNYLADLRRNGLIQVNGNEVIASGEMFE